MERNPSGAASAQSVSPPRVERREKRLHVAVPVKLFTEPDSSNYQLCCTYEISLTGARLVAVAGVNKVGQILWIQRQNRRAKYKVIWIGEPDTELAQQVGVETLEPANVIWENELRMRIGQKSLQHPLSKLFRVPPLSILAIQRRLRPRRESMDLWH